MKVDSMIEWLAKQPKWYRDGFNTGRAWTREQFAREDEANDDKVRHNKAIRDIIAGKA